MGGLSTVVASAVIIILLLEVIVMYQEAFLRFTESMEESLSRIAETKIMMIKESIKITDIVIVNSTFLYVNVTNNGKVGIIARDFSKIDVILVYIAQVNSSKVTLWLPYDASMAVANGWRVKSAYVGSTSKELINPINLPSANSGIWDPNETLQLEVWLDSNNALDTSEGVVVIIVALNGASSIYQV